jgi:hypothetical protein
VTAAELLSLARWAGLDLWLEGSEARVAAEVSPELLERLRDHRPELVEILTGRRCRCCSTRITVERPAALLLPGGEVECFECVGEPAPGAHNWSTDPEALVAHRSGRC